MTENTELALTFAPTPIAVLASEQAYSEFYERMKAELAAFKPDTTTPTGRKAIASMAYKVTRTKTAIDDAGKQLNAEARAKIDAVDASRRKVRAELDALADEVRKPLTEWEEAEKIRLEQVENWFVSIRTDAFINGDDTSETIEARLRILRGESSVQIEPTEEVFGERFEEAKADLAETIAALTKAHERALKSEADAAELERLRQEQAERLAEAEAAAQAEAERKAQEEEKERQRLLAERQAAAIEAEKVRQAEERARLEAEAEERERQAGQAAAAEANRIAEERREAEMRATREAHEAELKAEQERREELEQAIRDRQAEAHRMATEQAARDADRAHRSAVMKAAKQALMDSVTLEEQQAKVIVLAIIAGHIPNVTLKF